MGSPCTFFKHKLAFFVKAKWPIDLNGLNLKSFDQLLDKQTTLFSIYPRNELCTSLRNENKSVKHEKGRSSDQPQMT